MRRQRFEKIEPYLFMAAIAAAFLASWLWVA